MGKCNNNDYDDDRFFDNDRGFENERRNDEDRCNENDEREHVHEYGHSVKLAEENGDRHNHRVAGMTGKPIYISGSRGDHVHKIEDRTDSLDHLHEICVTTGPMIRIPGTNKHVHRVCGKTSFEDCHCHEFLFTTHIENPLV